MDFETELAFYMVSFILICFRLLRLTITASLWQTNAPGAKISRLAVAIAHWVLARYEDISKASIGESRVEAEGYWLCLPRSHISTIHHATLSAPNAHTQSHCYCRFFDKTKKEGVFYSAGPSVSIHWAFYHPLIQRSSVLVATKHPSQGACDGPRWWGKDREELCWSMVVGEQQTGATAHALLALQARGGYDRERADRAERRPSMEITSDQWWKIQWWQASLVGMMSHGACKCVTPGRTWVG